MTLEFDLGQPEEEVIEPPMLSLSNEALHVGGDDAAAFHRFLRAKRSVDDRALHKGVYTALRQHLAAWKHAPANASRDAIPHNGAPLRVLEIGCGIGSMVERLATWGLWEATDAPIHYTALDREAANLQAMQQLDLPRITPPITVFPCCADFFTFAEQAIATGERWDLLIAHAVLDLLDLERALPMLAGLLHHGGAAWLTINFDGGTILLPTIDRSFDDWIEARYHRTMDNRLVDGAPAGDSRTGRKLFRALPAAGLDIVAAGASDWIVTPTAAGYPHDEATFLHAIVATMQNALATDDTIAPQALAHWIATRRAQIEAHTLTYLAKQYDFLVTRHSL